MMTEPRDEEDRQLLADIDKHGWCTIAVEPEEEDEYPPFAYTVGIPRT